MPFSRGSSWPRDWTQVSCIACRFFTVWATREAPIMGISLVQFSCSVVSDSLRPHELQHTRPPCPSPTPGVHPDSRPSSQWCHPAISSSVVPFFSCPQSLPGSESFPMSQLFAWGGQSTGVSALASFQRNPRADLLQNGLVGTIGYPNFVYLWVQSTVQLRYNVTKKSFMPSKSSAKFNLCLKWSEGRRGRIL